MGSDETDFEEFCFQLLDGLDGFSNVDWRKGTPKQASPADRGRDIAAEVERVDVHQAKHVETWFIDCKHYEKGVPPTALQGLLAWAHAERPHVALAIASGYLSNACKDYLRDDEENNRPPFASSIGSGRSSTSSRAGTASCWTVSCWVVLGARVRSSRQSRVLRQGLVRAPPRL